MIIEKAQELGLALSESAEFCRMLEAKAAMDADTGVQNMTREYTQKREEIVRLMEDEDADKAQMMELSRQLDEVQGALMVNPVFMEMMDAQKGFQSLMQQVNRAIAACIGFDDAQAEGPEGGCAGSCSSCAGCKH